MSSPKLTKRQKILFIAFILGLGGFLLLRGIRINFKDTNELVTFLGLVLTMAGLLLGAWQIILAINANTEAKETSVQSALDTMRRESDQQDRRHDDQIASLVTRVEAIATQMEHHEELVGHTETIKQLLAIKDLLGELQAAIKYYSREGETLLRLQQIEDELRLIKIQKSPFNYLIEKFRPADRN